MKNTKATSAKTKKIRPVTVTLTGDLAERVRAEGKAIGFRADAWAKQLMKCGALTYSDTDDAKRYRLQMAFRELKEQGASYVGGIAMVNPAPALKKPVTSTETSHRGEIEMQSHPDGTGTILISGYMAASVAKIAKRMGISSDALLAQLVAELGVRDAG